MFEANRLTTVNVIALTGKARSAVVPNPRQKVLLGSQSLPSFAVASKHSLTEENLGAPVTPSAVHLVFSTSEG